MSMRLRKRLLKNCSLYAVLDKKTAGKASLAQKSKTLVQAGVDIVQFRDKEGSTKEFLQEALRLQAIFIKTKTLFILNDHVDLAAILECDGVHLGQDDLPLPLARRLLGKEKLIGISCHSLSQALKAQKEGADYLGIGPVFPTPTKPQSRAVGLELIRRCQKKIAIPFFAIGGIGLRNASLVASAGAKRIAVCRALCCAKNTNSAAAKFNEILAAYFDS